MSFTNNPCPLPAGTSPGGNVFPPRLPGRRDILQLPANNA
jgi:hypothetical protein